MNHVSVSQIKKFRACPSQWHRRYVDGEPEPTTEAQRFGQECHKAFEDLCTGHDVEPGRALDVAEAAVQALRPTGVLGPGWFRVHEDPIGLDPHGARSDWTLAQTEVARANAGMPPVMRLAGVPVAGFIDLLAYNTETDELRIIDLKTTSAWKWCPDKEQLAHDTQLLIYADYGRAVFPGVRNIHVAHVTVCKSDLSARYLGADVDGARVDAAVLAAEDTVLEMLEAENLPIDQVHGNTQACGAFGGCPYKPVCRHAFAPEVQAVLLAPATGADALARLRARVGNAPAVPEAIRRLRARVAARAAVPDVIRQDPPPYAIVPPDAAPPAEPLPEDVAEARAKTWQELPTEALRHKGLTPRLVQALIAQGWRTLGQVYEHRALLTQCKGIGPKTAGTVCDLLTGAKDD